MFRANCTGPWVTQKCWVTQTTRATCAHTQMSLYTASPHDKKMLNTSNKPVEIITLVQTPAYNILRKRALKKIHTSTWPWKVILNEPGWTGMHHIIKERTSFYISKPNICNLNPKETENKSTVLHGNHCNRKKIISKLIRTYIYTQI